MANVMIAVPEEVITAHFLRLSGALAVFPWERDFARTGGAYWRMVKISHNLNRDGVICVLEENGVELKRTEIPFAIMFDWFERLISLADKAAREAEKP